MALQIIGAGFGRTGTLSIKGALEDLGFSKCYHMREVFKNPQHAALWQAAADGKPTDWDALLEGYQATVDWPGCTFYKELTAKYPDAKVLLNVRDPEAWYKSANDTIYETSQPGFSPFFIMSLVPRIRRMIRLSQSLIWRNTFNNRFEDKDYAISVFKDHIEAVKAAVPAENLLVYSVKEGWEPLCRFLEVDVPDKPFPHLHDSATFRRFTGLGMFRRRSKA